MDYLLNGKEYKFSYRQLKDKYVQFCELSDVDFLLQLPQIIHFACFVSYVKELSLEQTLSDVGIVHQLVHLIADDEPGNDLHEIRQQFISLMKL